MHGSRPTNQFSELHVVRELQFLLRVQRLD